MDSRTPSLPSERVWQAQAIVAKQAPCALHEALTKMKERARIDGRSLEDIAGAVVSDRMKFD